VNAAAGSPKFDNACSLDLLALAASYSFTTKMKVDAVTLLESLEAWVDKQAASLDLAQNLEKLAQSFDSLLNTMDALYQVCVWAATALAGNVVQSTPAVAALAQGLAAESWVRCLHVSVQLPQSCRTFKQAADCRWLPLVT
jgi:hypothetical protein